MESLGVLTVPLGEDFLGYFVTFGLVPIGVDGHAVLLGGVEGGLVGGDPFLEGLAFAGAVFLPGVVAVFFQVIGGVNFVGFAVWGCRVRLKFAVAFCDAVVGGVLLLCVFSVDADNALGGLIGGCGRFLKVFEFLGCRGRVRLGSEDHVIQGTFCLRGCLFGGEFAGIIKCRPVADPVPCPIVEDILIRRVHDDFDDRGRGSSHKVGPKPADSTQDVTSADPVDKPGCCIAYTVGDAFDDGGGTEFKTVHESEVGQGSGGGHHFDVVPLTQVGCVVEVVSEDFEARVFSGPGVLVNSRSGVR